MKPPKNLEIKAGDAAVAYARAQKNFYFTVCRDEFNQGYTAGALEVLAQAEKLVKALEYILLYGNDLFQEQQNILDGYKAWKGE